MEEQIYLICEESKRFYKEFHNNPCIVERHVDFASISDYQLDECFDFIHLKEFASEKILCFSNLVAKFYTYLRIKKSPLILFSLVKGIMITLGNHNWELFWVFMQPSLRFMVRPLTLLIGINQKHSP